MGCTHTHTRTHTHIHTHAHTSFQGVDWRDDRNWHCNGGIDPAGPEDVPYDGTWLDPLESMFVRVKSNLLLHRLPSAVKAAKLSAWEAGATVDRLRAAAREPVDPRPRILGEPGTQASHCLADSRGPAERGGDVGAKADGPGWDGAGAKAGEWRVDGGEDQWAALGKGLEPPPRPTG
jgi:hypothetical protein